MQFLGEKIEKKYFVYADVDLNKMQVFYYGSGNIDRILDESRNKIHDRRVAWTGKNFARYIIYQSNNRKECYDIEKIYIALAFINNYKNKPCLTNKLVDSNNNEEFEEFLAKEKFIKPQPKLIHLFDGLICKNKRYYLLTNLNTNERYIANTSKEISRFEQFKGTEREKREICSKYSKLCKKKVRFERGIKYNFQIERVDGEFLINMFGDILQNIDSQSLKSMGIISE